MPIASRPRSPGISPLPAPDEAWPAQRDGACFRVAHSESWLPTHLLNSVRMALADCPVESNGNGADAALEIDPDWREPGLSASES